MYTYIYTCICLHFLPPLDFQGHSTDIHPCCLATVTPTPPWSLLNLSDRTLCITCNPPECTFHKSYLTLCSSLFLKCAFTTASPSPVLLALLAFHLPSLHLPSLHLASLLSLIRTRPRPVWYGNLILDDLHV